MKIITDSTPMEEPKNPDHCNVFALYRLLASPEQIQNMRKNYEAGNYGYGHAKQELFELVRDKFADEREKYNYYLENPVELDERLKKGERKAKEIAQSTLAKVRKKLGFA